MARGNRSFRGGRRADYTWAGINSFSGLTFGGTQLFLGSALLSGQAGTIVRVRGHVQTYLDVGAADDAIVVAFGLILGTEEQVAIGSTAFPSPADDLDAEWLYHAFFAMKSLTSTQEANRGGQALEREIDSKAMRKFKPTQSLVAMADGVIQAGSPTADIHGAYRVLIAQ